MKIFYTFLLSAALAVMLLPASLKAQTRPYINAINPVIANVGETVTIVGSGFPPNASDLQVTFGGVTGTIVSNSSTLIEVTVPAAATYDEIIVSNTSTGLSGASSAFFMVSYGGNEMAGVSATVFRTLFETVQDLNIDITAGQTQNFPYDICLCDFDQDGKQDVVVTSQENPSGGGSKRVVFRNTSTVTTLNLTPVLELRNQPSRNATCNDIDGDGKPDLVISEVNGPNDSGTIDIEVYRNTSSSGTISFANEILLQLPRDQNGDIRTPARVELADLDQDGKKEIISTTINDNAIDIFLNQSTVGSISFANSDITKVELPDQTDIARALKVADLNKDGLKDIILAVNEGSGIYVFENQSTAGTLRFKEAQLVSVTGQLIIQNIEAADINDDGYPEIIISDGNAAQTTGELIVIQNTTATEAGSISYGTANRFTTNSGPWGISTGDIDGDGQVDLVSAAANQNAIDILINQSSTTSIDFQRFTLAANNNSRNIKIADINGDVKPDILAVTNSRTLSPGSLSVFVNRNCVTPKLTPTSDIYCPGTSFIMEATPAEETTFKFEVSTNNGSSWTSKQTGSSNTYDLGLDGSNTTNVLVRVTATSNDGKCITTSAAASISLNTVTPNYGTFSINAPSNACAGADLTLSTTITADSYVWSGPNGFSSTDQNPTIPTIQASAGGTYQLVIQNNGGCKSAPVTRQVSVIATPEPNFVNTGDDAFCDGGQTVLETTDFPGFTRQWNLNGSPTGQTGTSLTVDATGVVTLTLTSQTNTSCSSTGESLEINEVNRPSPTIQTDSEICVDVPLNLNTTVSGASAYNYTYAWDIQDAASSSVQTGTEDNLEVTFTSAGTYTANLTVGYELVSNCATAINQNILASSPPDLPITASATVKCPTDTVTLEMPTDLVSYLWSTGDTTSNSVAITPEGIDTLNIDVTVITSVGCTVNSTIQVTNFDDGGISISSVDTGIPIVDQSLSIPSGILSIQLQANGGTNYQWAPESIFDNPEASLVTVRPRAVQTDILLTGIDINGCLESDSLRMINDNVQARKSFSPDGNGLGFECWEILNSSTLQGCTVYILDKRGRTIYESSDFENDCAWNGIDLDGKPAPEGVYYFVMKCDDTDFNRTGNLLLGRQ